MHYLGIEIGGTKLQLGIGPADGTLTALWRGNVNVAAGPEGIRKQIVAAVPELLAKGGLARNQLRGVGIGFGGPVDDSNHTIIKSHQIEGWDNFPLANWISEVVGLPAALGNDADVAGLGEALFGAGKGYNPVFYITIGSGIGGGLIINGEIYRGTGRGAAEIGHTKISDDKHLVLEDRVSGWGIAKSLQAYLAKGEGRDSALLRLAEGDPSRLTAQQVAQAAEQGDPFAVLVLHRSWAYLAEAICDVVSLLCPRRIIIGGGVSLMGEKLLFEPLRRLVAERVFKCFADCYEIVPAALGEEVVVHGALALAKKRLS
jgi:glucokinase